jgi:hypothetical protein
MIVDMGHLVREAEEESYCGRNCNPTAKIHLIRRAESRTGRPLQAAELRKTRWQAVGVMPKRAWSTAVKWL